MRRLTSVFRDTLPRVIADIALINLSLAGALMLRFLVIFGANARNPDASVPLYSLIWDRTVDAYTQSAPLLTGIGLVLFYTSGFYTYSRMRRSRYKAVVIFQAVTITYLLFGFLTYTFHPSAFPQSPFPVYMPRSALVTAWVLTLAAVGGARLGASLWKRATSRNAVHHRGATVRNVLVVGGAGYIGSILIRKLLSRGYRVTVLDALLYGDESIRELYGRPGFVLVKDDLRNIEAVVRTMESADAVIHLGALVGDPACALDEKLTVEINLAATRMIAEAARGFSIERFVFASTCSVYGAADHTLDERSELNPVSLYARTKIDSERVLLQLNDETFSPVILRFGTIYGMSPRPRFDLVVNTLVAHAVKEKQITIFGGQQWRPFIHVDDVAEAIIVTLEAPVAAVKGQTFNVGSDDENYRICELGELIQRHIPDVKVVQQGDDVDQRNYRVSFEKIRKQLGYRPRYTVSDGIVELKGALEAGRVANYQDVRFNNVMALSEEGGSLLVRQTIMTPLYSLENTGVQEESTVVPTPGAAAP